MLIFIGLIIFVLGLLWLYQHRQMRWLKHGAYSRRANFAVNQQRYYLEETKFSSYREAFGAYEKIIDDVCCHGKVINMKYDLYDWTVTYIQFDDVTVGIQLYRPKHIIQLVQSKKPVQIHTMEADNPFLF